MTHVGGKAVTTQTSEFDYKAGAATAAAVSTVSDHPAGATAVSAEASGQAILIADDDRVVRYVVGQMLSRLGYQVSYAEDGFKARELFEQTPDAFDLLIIDLTMPGMNGTELISQLKLLRPAQRILVTTGHTDSDQVQELLRSGEIDILTKPFNFEDLQGWIDKQL